MKEHKGACNRGRLEIFAIAEHVWRHDHPIKRHDTQVLDRAGRHKELLVKEVLHIRMEASNSSFNRDGGVELHAGSLLLRAMSKGVNTTTYATGMLRMAPW